MELTNRTELLEQLERALSFVDEPVETNLIEELCGSLKQDIVKQGNLVVDELCTFKDMASLTAITQSINQDIVKFKNMKSKQFGLLNSVDIANIEGSMECLDYTYEQLDKYVSMLNTFHQKLANLLTYKKEVLAVFKTIEK